MAAQELPKDSLFDLLREYLTPEQQEEICEVLAPYYDMEDKESYPFRTVTRRNRVLYAHAIQQALGLETLPKIIVFPRFHPYIETKPGRDVWDDRLRDSLDNRWRRILKDILGQNTNDRLWGDLWDSLGRMLWDRILCSLREGVWDRIRAILWNNPWDSQRVSIWIRLRAVLRDAVWTSPYGVLGDSLWLCLFYYIGFMLAGKPEVAERLKPLIALQSRGIIVLGDRRGQPGTWIVVGK